MKIHIKANPMLGWNSILTGLTFRCSVAVRLLMIILILTESL